MMNALDPTIPRYGAEIELKSGDYLSFVDPDPSVINIDVVAGPLSRLCRFAGQINYFYCVAQHSVLVSYLVPEEFRLEALLHDVTEAFMADMPKPLKMIMPQYEEIEERVWLACAKAFGINPQLPECVHIADKMMVLAEARDLLNTDTWQTWYPDLPVPESRVTPLKPLDAEDLFLQRYHQLRTERPHNVTHAA
jgi:hypothetical protein